MMARHWYPPATHQLHAASRPCSFSGSSALPPLLANLGELDSQRTVNTQQDAQENDTYQQIPMSKEG